MLSGENTVLNRRNKQMPATNQPTQPSYRRLSGRCHPQNLLASIAFTWLAAVGGSAAAGETARGVVFHDQNANGTREASEPGIPNVNVSNGVDVVSTDEVGGYELPVDDDTIVFVIKPRNWQTQLNEMRLPRFFYNHKPAGSPDDDFELAGVEPTGPLPESIDFGLTPSDEPEEFSVVLMGDPQPYSRQEVRYYANDVIAELVDAKAALGISLGDLVGDKLSLFEYVNAVQSKVGVPWYNVHGNHDINFHSPNDKYADETFERIYGPANFAFQWASVHFVILDNVRWNGYATDNKGNLNKDNYTGNLSDNQLQFVGNYVSKIATDELIVVCTHIPLVNPTSEAHGSPQLARLLKLLAKHPHQLSFSAHTHYNRHDFVGGPKELHTEHEHADLEDAHHHFQLHHHHNTATGSGSWYRGPKDEQGLPMTPMRDGVPNGYVIATFSGSSYKLRYKAARMPADFQMSIFVPEPVSAEEASKTEVVANVFNGNEKSSVRMRVRDASDWIPMTRTEGIDPTYRAMYLRDQADKDRPHTAMPGPVATPHLWVTKLPTGIAPGMHVLEVESTDMFDQVDRSVRIIEVVGPRQESSSNIQQD